MTHAAIPIPDITFKDDTPLSTVARIKEILRSCGIETEERWNESGVPYCYSVRISVCGTVFGVNGKGVTKEFALASGYGELMERLQMGKVFVAEQQKNGQNEVGRIGETYMSVRDVLSRNPEWYARYVEKIHALTGAVLTEEELLKPFFDPDGNTHVTQFYYVNTKKNVYLPTSLLNMIYSTNGCAAGNSIEEALVQAISEIVERAFSNRILSEGIPVPNIPEKVLHECPVAYKIITYLREQNFHVMVKDCSLGTKFPVVCVCLIDKKTGRYHTHFGAYPNFEIALQRTLTESFQGRNIKEVANFENFLRVKQGSIEVGNLLNQLVKGTAERRPDFFTATEETYSQPQSFSGANNRELLKECIAFFADQGYDVLIRDYSCLGFPTYQVIIPGYSEVYTHRFDPNQNDMRFYKFGQSVLRDPSTATIEDIMGFMMNLTQMTKRKLGIPQFSSQINLPAQLNAKEEQYLLNATMAYLNYTLGRKTEVLRFIDQMLSTGIQNGMERLICIKRYLMLHEDGYTQEDIQNILEQFHQKDTIEKLYNDVAEQNNLLEEFVLHCDLQCRPSCILFEVCKKRKTEELIQFIHTKQQELDDTKICSHLEQLLI